MLPVQVGMHVSLFLWGAGESISYCLGSALRLKSSPEMWGIIIRCLQFVNNLEWFFFVLFCFVWVWKWEPQTPNSAMANIHTKEHEQDMIQGFQWFWCIHSKGLWGTKNSSKALRIPRLWEAPRTVLTSQTNVLSGAVGSCPDCWQRKRLLLMHEFVGNSYPPDSLSRKMVYVSYQDELS